MPDVLLLGLSRFARKRVVPALDALDAFGSLHVASRSAADSEIAALPKLGRVFRDYGEAIDAMPKCLVYVSLTNDAHARWAERALLRGHHVVVDKPAFVDLATSRRLVALARERSLLLAEALPHAFHPVFAQLCHLFEEYRSAPTHVSVAFTPPIGAQDYRYQVARGGGALLDLGPYFASIGRVLWGAAPTEIVAFARSGPEVETSFSVLARYGADRVLVGHYGFTTEYRNWINLLGPALSLEASRIFSTPPEWVTPVTIRHADVTTVREVAPANAMRIFLDEVLGALARSDWTSFAETLLEDARVLEQLRRAAVHA